MVEHVPTSLIAKQYRVLWSWIFVLGPKGLVELTTVIEIRQKNVERRC
jgi:hypothetical protein